MNLADYYNKCTLYSSQVLINLNFLEGFFKKFSNINFHEYPSSGMPVDPCGQTDMTKLTVGCRNFGKAPKNNFCNLYALAIRTKQDIW